VARTETITIQDDIDGSNAAETVEFSLDGAQFAIDLSAKNAKLLRKSLAEFVGAARQIKTVRVSPSVSAGRRQPTSGDRAAELFKLRKWGQENGFAVGDRGRISQAVREAYAAAH
jgi:hypothetical protein